jgi:hypothetical protein
MPRNQTPKSSAGRKKSVSKASASKGRENSRAVNVRRRKEARSRKSQSDPAELADVYRERQEDEINLGRKKMRTPQKKTSST